MCSLWKYTRGPGSYQRDRRDLKIMDCLDLEHINAPVEYLSKLKPLLKENGKPFNNIIRCFCRIVESNSSITNIRKK